MKKKKAFCKFPFLLFSLLFVFGQKVMAQDEIDFTGYANVWYTLKVVNDNGGKICATASVDADNGMERPDLSICNERADRKVRGRPAYG